jgi:hypothetical protein
MVEQRDNRISVAHFLMAAFAQSMPEGVVTAYWKLLHVLAGNTASGNPLALSSGMDEAASPSRQRHGRLVCGALLCVVISSGPGSQAALSHSAPSLQSLSERTASIVRQIANSIEFYIEDIVGTAGDPIPLNIEVSKSEKDSGGRLFIFSGIPNGVELSPGGNLGLFWAVNSNAFDRLTLLAPDGFEGSFEIEVTQTGTTPEDTRRKSTFLATIKAPVTQANTQTLNAIVPPTKLQNDPLDKREPTRTLPNLRDNKLMERAFSLFSNGDISAARAIFQYLVARGNADAAIAVGGTYDPLVLRQLFIKGMMPDPEQARIWYEKAEELGSPEARNRLTALAGR